MRWPLLILLVLAPATASAAACCMSASVVGTGRLLNWEDAAAGLSTGWGHDLGRFDSGGTFRAFGAGLLEDEFRVEAWGIVRLHERWQLSARVPWVTGIRASSGVSSIGTGIGDVAAAVRWEPISLGEYEWVPGVALLAQVTTPTGRRPEQATDPLGASATGRGAWAASLGLTLEQTKLPWFIRLDAAFVYTAPFVRADTQQLQAFGPGLQAALSGGRELLQDKLVLALILRLEHEFPLAMNGAMTPDSESTGLSAALAASFKLTPHWMLVGSVSTDAPGRLGLAQNRSERLAFNLGVRHGFF